MNTDSKIKRGFWSLYFWISCLASIATIILIPLLFDPYLTPDLKIGVLAWGFLVVVFWGWRIKFVFMDLNSKHIKIDIIISMFIIGVKAIASCMMFFLEGSDLVWLWIPLIAQHTSGIILDQASVHLYETFLQPFGETGVQIATVLGMGLNPIRLLYLITEVKLFKRINTTKKNHML